MRPIFLSVVFLTVSAYATPPVPAMRSPDAGGIAIPSNGQVSIISIDQLPLPSRESATKDKKRFDTSSLAGEGVLEHRNLEEAQVAGVDQMIRSAKPEEFVAGKLRVKLATTGAEFADLKFVGFYPEGTAKDGPWSWMARLFVGSNGEVVRLSEWDFRADNGGLLLIKEFLNQEVSGSPATLSISKAKSGRVLWSLTWSREGKQYTLDLLTASFNLDDKKRILALGNGLRD
jgi:hypothetical protein